MTIPPDKIKVIHDFDSTYPSGRESFKRGLKLIVYAISKKVHFLRRFCEDVYMENYSNAEVLAKLDSLLGIPSHFGINRRVQPTFPQLKSQLELLGATVSEHWHEGNIDARWSPELPFDLPKTFRDYHYDQVYASGKIDKALVNDVLCFHVDRPILLGQYIKALYDIEAGSG